MLWGSYALIIDHNCRENGLSGQRNMSKLFLKVCMLKLMTLWEQPQSTANINVPSRGGKKKKKILNNGSSFESMHLKKQCQQTASCFSYLWWQSSIFCASALFQVNVHDSNRALEVMRVRFWQTQRSTNTLLLCVSQLPLATNIIYYWF